MSKPITSQTSIKNDALALFQAGRITEAKPVFEAICKRSPQDADAWFFLGIIHGQLGELEKSEYCCRKTVKLAPRSHAAWDNLGLALMLQGKRAEATNSFMHALQVNPNDEQAHNNLGTLLRDQGELDMAFTHYRRAIELKPDFAEAYNNLGNMLHDRSQIKEALACYERALQIEPRYVDAHYNRGMAQQKLGLYDAALSSYQSVLTLSPGHADAITGIANVREKQGDYQKAHDILWPLVSGSRATVSSAITFAAAARRLGKHYEAIAISEQLLGRKDLSLEQRQELHFSLGALYDEVEKYAQAFEHFRKGNTVRPYPQDVTSQPAYFTKIIETFSAEAMRRAARSSVESERPIFIVGMPRSGTTLVEQILASHERVHGGGELRGIEDAIGSLRQTLGTRSPYPDFVPDASTDALDLAARGFLDKLDELSPAAARVTDKMPHNFLHLGLIEQLFPKARIIHCTREPMDTCLSIYFHNFNANHPYTTDLAALGTYYNQYLRLMRHWESVLSLPIHTVSYEALVDNQEETTRAMLEYCNLDWDPACLRFHENKRVVTTPSYQQVRRPLYRSSVQRWRHYAPYLKPLIDALNADAG
jgi:tetratricopeptide (TPR) repeat protein